MGQRKFWLAAVLANPLAFHKMKEMPAMERHFQNGRNGVSTYAH